MKDWLKKTLANSDLVQGYVNLLIDRLDGLTREELVELCEEIKCVIPTGPETAATLAILTYLLDEYGFLVKKE